MSEIPEDIIKSANAFQDMVNNDPKAYTAFDVAVLAIVKERNRCAKIAEGVREESDSYNGAYDGISDVIKAILNQTER